MPQCSLALKIVIDLFVTAVLGISLLFLLLWGVPYQRGFFPDDLSVRLNYKQQQVSEAVLAGVGFAVAVVVITSVEVICDKQGKGIGEKFLCGHLLPGWAWDSYCGVGVFVFGAACQQLTTNVAKYTIGRLRPFFYDVCRPVFDSSLPANQLGYIQEFTCSGTRTELFQNMRLSFPSAHSSFAMYTALFLIFFIQVKAKWRGSKLARHFFQFAILIAAWYVGLSRVVDHMHHWEDVLVGYLVGAAFAVIVFKYVLKPKNFGPASPWQGPQAGQADASRLPRPVLAR